MTKSEEALVTIRNLIVTDQIGKDGSLFSENEIANRIGMSRTPIRDALTILAKEGLIEQIPQIGIRRKTFDDGDLREIYDVREFLEAYATERFAANPRPDLLIELDNLLAAMRIAAENCDVAAFLSADTKFHEVLAEGAGLHFVRDILELIGSKVRVIGYISSPSVESMKVVVLEHENIMNAVRERNPEHARERALEHIHLTKKRLEIGRERKIFGSSSNDRPSKDAARISV